MVNFKLGKNKTLIIVVLILAIVFIFISHNSRSNKTKFDFTEVKRGDIYQIVSATGQVKTSKELELNFETSGKIKQIRVKEGEKVKKGDLLMSLDSQELENQVLSAEANKKMAQANLDELMEGARPEDIKIYQTAVDNARIAFSNAQIALSDAQKKLLNVEDENNRELSKVYQSSLVVANSSYDVANKAILKTLKNLKDNVFPPDTALDSKYNLTKLALVGDDENEGADDYLRQANSSSNYDDSDKAIDKLEVALDKARDCLTFTRDAMEGPGYEDYVTAADKAKIDTEIININTSISNLNNAKQSIIIQKVTNQNSITNAESNLDNCRNALNTAKGNLDSALAQLEKIKSPARKVDINKAKAQLEQAEAELALARVRLSKAKILAPVDGIITKVNKEVGETISPQESAISMIGLGKFKVESDIPEADISKVKVGDLAKITFDALPNVLITSSVAEIDPASTMIEGVPTYKITLYLEKNILGVKPGMTANIDILTASRKNVICVPRRAIIEKDGKKLVRLVINDKNYKEVPVETGIYGDKGNIEIVRGLKEGDKVVTFIHYASH